MKKIFHIIPSLNSGGAERMLFNLVKNSDKSRFTHCIITLKPGEFYEQELENHGIKIYRYNLKGFNIVELIKLLNNLKQADIVQSWMYHSDLLAFIFGKVLLRKKVIWGIRRSYLDKALMKKSTLLIAKICSVVSSKVDLIVCNSKVGKKSHVNFGYSESKIKVIPNGFDLELFQDYHLDVQRKKRELNIDFGTKVLLNVARWEPLKDHQTFLKAISILKEEYNNFVVLMCGSGIDYENQELVCKIEEFNLSNHIKLLGVREDIPQILSISDVFVSSSISEGFPNAVGEAMASEVYPVVTDAGDTSFIVGEYGSIVPIGKPQMMAKEIFKVINIKAFEKQSIEVKARQRIEEKFSIQSIVSKFEELYK